MMPFRLRHADSVVGVFILLSVAAVVGAAFFVLRASAMFEERVRYYTIFREGYGIAPGNSVTLLGIDVGRVQTVEITQSNRVQVVFDVRKSFANRVRQDSVAEVKSPPGLGGFIGGTGIKVSVGDPSEPPIPPDSYVKAVNPMGLDDILAMVKGDKDESGGPTTTDRVKTTLGNVEKLIASLGADDGPVQSILRDVAQITSDVREGKGSPGKILKDDGRLLAEVEGTMRQVRGSLARVERILLGVDGLVGDVRGVVGETPATIGKVNALLDQVARALAGVADIVVELQGVTKKMGGYSDDVPRLLGDVESQLRQLDEILAATRKSFPLRYYMDAPPQGAAYDPGLRDAPAAGPLPRVESAPLTGPFDATVASPPTFERAVPPHEVPAGGEREPQRDDAPATRGPAPAEPARDAAEVPGDPPVEGAP